MAAERTSFSVSIPADVMRRIEDVRDREGKSIDGVVTEALQAHLDNREWQEILDYGTQRAREARIEPEQVDELIHEYRSNS